MGEQSLSDKTMREMYPGIPSKHSFIPTVSVFRHRDDVDGDAILPERKTTEAYCYDICAYLPEKKMLALPPLHVLQVPTGLYLALPPHWSALVCSRSGLAAQGVQVINAPGVIDSDYRDEVRVLLTFVAPYERGQFMITHGMRIAQLLFLPPAPALTIQDVPTRLDLPKRDTTRMGGFGSTGLV
jgi:dUTP pyrophosphatase